MAGAFHLAFRLPVFFVRFHLTYLHFVSSSFRTAHACVALIKSQALRLEIHFLDSHRAVTLFGDDQFVLPVRLAATVSRPVNQHNRVRIVFQAAGFFQRETIREGVIAIPRSAELRNRQDGTPVFLASSRRVLDILVIRSRSSRAGADSSCR